MRNSINKAIGDTLQDLINSGGKTSFSVKELKLFGIEIPSVKLSASDIKKIRKSTHLSQNVFARLLNVSLSSVRQWEQGKRIPTGATKVLLELLLKKPDILFYRIVTKS